MRLRDSRHVTGPGLRRFQGSNDLTGEWAKQRNAQKKAITEQIAPQLVSLWVRRDTGSKWRVCRVQAQRHRQINTTIEESSRQMAAVADQSILLRCHVPAPFGDWLARPVAMLACAA